jgi:hypothetical protein
MRCYSWDELPAAIAEAKRRREEREAAGRRLIDELVPWDVRPEHQDADELLMLHWTAEDLEGGGIPEGPRLERFLDWLGDRIDTDTVVHYDPDAGFSYVPARPDEDYIRHPDTE